MNIFLLFYGCGFTGPLVAVLIGWKEAGIIGALIGLFIGLLVGIGNVLGYRAFFDWVLRWEDKHRELSIFMIIPAFLWLYISGGLAVVFTRFVIHYVAS